MVYRRYQRQTQCQASVCSMPAHSFLPLSVLCAPPLLCKTFACFRKLLIFLGISQVMGSAEGSTT